MSSLSALKRDGSHRWGVVLRGDALCYFSLGSMSRGFLFED